MTGSLRVFAAETYRLVRGRTALWTALLLGLASALRVAAARVSAILGQNEAVQKALAAGRPVPEAPPPGNAYGPFVDGWLAGLTVGTLLLFILAARSLAADRESGLLRLASTRSASRAALVLGRALLGVPVVAGVVAVTGLGAWISARGLFVFGPLVEHGYELMSVDELHAALLRSVLATLPPLLATWCFGLAVSSAARSSAAAVGAGLAIYLGFDLFKEVLGEGRYWVFASFNPSFVDNSLMHEMTGIARGFSDAGYSEALYRTNLVLPWPEALLLLGLASWIMGRRSL